jgi:LysR family cys regulon transcriptional activator
MRFRMSAWRYIRRAPRKSALNDGTDLGIATDTLDDYPGLIAFPYYTWEHVVVVPAGHPLEGEKL